MSPTTRRSFLKTGLAVGAMATVGSLPLAAAQRAGTFEFLRRNLQWPK
jgi:hypothetical protein